MSYTKQIEILEEMQSHGFNVCNCGNCGGVMLFNKDTKPTLEDDNEDVNCPHCKITLAYSDCPDYYYQGMPEADNG